MKIKDLIEPWYKKHQRDLPFRKTSDPYAIWVSEIMAQQTRIDTMIPYYLRWMEKWPTIQDLAVAKIEDVLHVWQGLGYYNRARKLVEGAKQIETEFQGVFPKQVEDIRSLAGIGDYTAGAIASIAFNLEEPAVDGNVFRVVTRFLMIEDDITKVATRRKITALCKTWMRDSEPSVFTQGMMELGATVCTFKSPTCSLCPLSEYCQAYAYNRMEDFPKRTKMKAPQEKEMYMYVLLYEDEICISFDDSDGLMKDFIRMPQQETRLDIKGEKKSEGKSKHIFSHRIWNIEWVEIHCEKRIQLENCQWIKKSELNPKSVITAHRKILNKLNIIE